MIVINERTVLCTLLGTIGISALFCLISLATPGWNAYTLFALKASSTAALAIISLLLLIGSLIVAGLILGNLLANRQLPLVFLSLLILSSIFLIATAGSFLSSIMVSYSFNLMMAALTFTYASSLLSFYWFFRLRDAEKQAPATTTFSNPQQTSMPEKSP